jgi:hypothetical protein
MPQQIDEAASRLGRYAGSTQSKEGKSDPVGNLQRFAAAEQERAKKKKKEEEERKKAQPVETAPQKGYLSQLYDKYVGSYFGGK